MKKVTRFIAVVMSILMVFCSINIIPVSAEETLEITPKTEKSIKVYDSKGNLIDEIDSMDELDKYFVNQQQRGVKEKIVEIVCDVLYQLAIQFLCNLIEDGWNYLNEYEIEIPPIEPGEVATVYSLDGNVFNPYPPNSYQAVTWKQTNFIVVVN